MDARETVVLHASALVDLLIGPGRIGEAIGTRLAGTAPVAPQPLPFEVANVLRRRRDAGQLSQAQATLALRGLGSMSIELWPFGVLVDALWRHGHNLSSYDAAYVALAERLGAPLITGDGRLARAPGIACRVEVYE